MVDTLAAKRSEAKDKRLRETVRYVKVDLLI